MAVSETRASKWLSTSDAADYCSVGKSTLEKLRLSGGGPQFVKLGARVIYEVADLDAWLNRHRFGSTSEYGATAHAA
jgi:hypothetical protein